MLQEHINNLNSHDAAIRKQAVIALGRSKDPSVLKFLAVVYRTDTDPEVRELALKAGRYIREQTDVPDPDLLVPAARAASEPPAERKITPRDVERAKAYIDQAVDFSVRHNEPKAIESLGRALELNPNAEQDVLVRNLAMELTGLSGADAMNTLRNPQLRRELIVSKGGSVQAVATLPEDTRDQWSAALIDLLIYGLVNGVVTFVSVLVVFPRIWQSMELYMREAGAGTMPPEVWNFMRTSSVPTALLYGLFSAVSAVIGYVILQGAVHLVATTVMGGQGTLPRLLRKTTLFYTGMLVVWSLVGSLSFVLVVNQAQVSETGLAVLSVLLTIFSIAVAIWSGKLTGSAYDFGTGRGCVSLLLGELLLVVVIGCCAFVLSFALAQSFSTLMQAGL